MSQPQFAPSDPAEQVGAGRIQALDVLRGVAILLVLGRHLPYLEQLSDSPLRTILGGWLHVGWAGVDLFFVLSGFLVSGLLFREYSRHGKLDLKRFYIRRGLKIYPPFYLMIALTAIALVAAGATGILARLVGHDSAPSSIWHRLLWEALYLQNYRMGFWPHTWSLAVEEHFYLILGGAFLLLLVRRRDSDDPFRLLLGGVPVVALLVLALRLYSVRFWDEQFSTLTFPTHLRLDTLLWGVWLSYLYHYHRRPLVEFGRRYRWPLGALAAVLISPAFVLDLERSTWLLTYGFSTIAIGSMIVLGLAVLQTAPSVGGFAGRAGQRLAEVVGAIGFYSYSIYLWHIPTGVVLYLLAERLFPERLAPAYILAHGCGYLVLSLLVGVVMARLIELPTLALRDRLFPSRSGTMSTIAEKPR